MQKPALRANAWVELAVQKYLDMVYRLAHARMGNRQDAEDVTQEVMLKLVRHAPRIEGEEHLRNWLIRVTVNECNNVFRSAWWWRNAPLEEAALAEKEDAHERSDALDAALSALNPKLRVVVHLFYYEDMKTDEIAAALGIKPSAVRERLHRARRKLKEQLTSEGGDGDV